MTLRTVQNILLVLGLAILPAILSISCDTGPKGPVGPHAPRDTESCASACANLNRLHCSAGEPVDCRPGDFGCAADSSGKLKMPCETFCRTIQNSGVWLNPACPFLTAAKSGDVTPPACPEVETQCAPH